MTDETERKSPFGMVCSVCGRDLPPYNFTQFRMTDDVDRRFFASARRDKHGFVEGVCWECNGPYRCLQCGEVKPASEFRLQGRYCKDCKKGWNSLVRARKTRAKIQRWL